MLMFYYSAALDTSCQVYPSEYAYKDNSVTTFEEVNANCRPYPQGNLPGGAHPEHYIHCDGVQLKLADSDLGQERYSGDDSYVWDVETKDKRLLFIFPTTVNLATITLHHYSDKFRGLPRLIFRAVPDDFNIWDTIPGSSTPAEVAAVPPGGEPAGRSNVSISVNFNTKKVLMQKFRSSFRFAVSEVEFSLTCNSKHTLSSLTVNSSAILLE